MPALDEIRVILVDPQDPRNLGSVCRAMKTMGLRRLIVTGDKQLDLDKASVTAVHAVDLLDSLHRAPTLAEALSDVVLAAGITRRRGKKRKYLSLTPEDLAARVALIKTGAVALVFGNEMAGLNDQDLSLCHLAVHIPTSPLFPSLNLSHAVQIVAYHIFRTNTVNSLYTPIQNQRLDDLVAVVTASLTNIGFFKQVDSKDMAVFWRDILARAALSSGEAKRMEIVFRKISGLITNRGLPPQESEQRDTPPPQALLDPGSV